MDLRYSRNLIREYFTSRDLPIPLRSVCNGCFAHSVQDHAELYQEPGDWSQAMAVDEAIRDWRRIGVQHPVYMSGTLKPLKELARQSFKLEGEAFQGCDSGYCFL